MTYKNTKTGQVITTTGKVSGGDWEQVQEKPATAPKAPANSQRNKK